MRGYILKRAFYDGLPEEVAKALLGKYLVRKRNGKLLIGKIVETEAYLSGDDEAAHGFRGIKNRNKSLYKAGGHAYIHRMRQWHLLDIVTEKEHVPSSVLIRAVEPVEGVEVMKRLRNTKDSMNLTNGPSKLCQAFEITHSLDGIDVTLSTSSLYVVDKKEIVSLTEIGTSGRIGISKSVDIPLRFWIKNNPFVSR